MSCDVVRVDNIRVRARKNEGRERIAFSSLQYRCQHVPRDRTKKAPSFPDDLLAKRDDAVVLSIAPCNHAFNNNNNKNNNNIGISIKDG